jgi:hypothetical protein
MWSMPLDRGGQLLELGDYPLNEGALLLNVS